MAHRSRSSACALAAVLPVPTSLVIVVAAALPALAGQIRITAVSNATLRSLPQTTAEVVAQVPLGTELIEAGPSGLDKTWVRVRLPDTREGWLLANLTHPLDPVWRWQTFDTIIAGRLVRAGDGFLARRELVEFIERVAPEYTDPDGRARVDLARLRALAAALRSIPPGGWRREPYASWLAVREGQVVYDEPGGGWILADLPIWELHVRHRESSSASEIAWLAVTNGLPGECEGYLPCYVARRNRLHGEYLRRDPDGDYAARAVDEIAKTAGALSARSDPRSGWDFDRQRDCAEFSASVEALSQAVGSTRVRERDAALAHLVTLRGFCR